MSLVDCLDSVFMLYAYTSAQRLEPTQVDSDDRASIKTTKSSEAISVEEVPITPGFGAETPIAELRQGSPTSIVEVEAPTPIPEDETKGQSADLTRLEAVKMSTISDLSIMLTVVSIVVALFISIVEFMGYVVAFRVSDGARS